MRSSTWWFETGPFLRAALARTIMLCLILACAAGAQSPVATQEAPSSANNLPEQRIGVNDLIALSVYGSPEFNRTIRVNQDGAIRLPMLKVPLGARGKLPAELEVAIAESLVAEQILINPVVTVTMVEYHSRPISVAGAVKRPTTFQAVGPVTLLDALARAEGLNESAGAEILVTRHQAGPDGEPLALVQSLAAKTNVAAKPSVPQCFG